jgi:hypothetical protein
VWINAKEHKQKKQFKTMDGKASLRHASSHAATFSGRALPLPHKPTPQTHDLTHAHPSISLPQQFTCHNSPSKSRESSQGAVICPFILAVTIIMDWTDGAESSGNSSLCMDVEEATAPSPATLEAILQQKKVAVETELQRLTLLPPHSSHVIHRKRVAHKALELLAKQERTPEEADELSNLFNVLSL